MPLLVSSLPRREQANLDALKTYVDAKVKVNKPDHDFRMLCLNAPTHCTCLHAIPQQRCNALCISCWTVGCRIGLHGHGWLDDMPARCWSSIVSIFCARVELSHREKLVSSALGCTGGELI